MSRPSPAIRPGLRCGRQLEAEWTTWVPALPGHQAGAPLRQFGSDDIAALEWIPPRPSGRGSVAADFSRPGTPQISSALPGHQAGAPLRRENERVPEVR